jgi:hypothetical protein
MRGVDGLTVAQVNEEVARGGRFIVFQWVISLLFVSYRRNSPIFFVKAGESTVPKALPYIGLSLVLGWWGIPWGFLWTPFSILRNLTGGINVTQSIVPSLKDHSLERRLDQDTNHWEEAAAFLKTVKPMSRSGAAGA